jgi:hypothetical protein
VCHPEVSATGVPDDRGGTSYGNLLVRFVLGEISGMTSVVSTYFSV